MEKKDIHAQLFPKMILEALQLPTVIYLKIFTTIIKIKTIMVTKFSNYKQN